MADPTPQWAGQRAPAPRRRRRAAADRRRNTRCVQCPTAPAPRHRAAARRAASAAAGARRRAAVLLDPRRPLHCLASALTGSCITARGARCGLRWTEVYEGPARASPHVSAPRHPHIVRRPPSLGRARRPSQPSLLCVSLASASGGKPPAGLAAISALFIDYVVTLVAFPFVLPLGTARLGSALPLPHHRLARLFRRPSLLPATPHSYAPALAHFVSSSIPLRRAHPRECAQQQSSWDPTTGRALRRRPLHPTMSPPRPPPSAHRQTFRTLTATLLR